MKSLRIAIAFMFALAALSSTAKSQTVTGQISGEVMDSSGAVIPGAKVTLKREVTNQALTPFTSDASGRFTFVGLIPGDYSLKVELAGFNNYEKTGIHVEAQGRFDVGAVKLTVGQVTSTIEVAAQVSHVESDSSSHGISLPQATIDATPSPGHNYLNLLENLPGAVHTGASDSRGWQAGGAPTINGAPGQLLVTINGVANLDSGNPGTGGYIAPSPDAIGEVKVLTGAYTADYGARAGGQMNVSFKNGTNRFHGAAGWDWRHETLNANNWFNNKNTVTVNGIPGQATAKPKYRYQDYTVSLGGPLLIPGTRFNRSRSKLFFFFSEDYLHNISNPNLRQFNLPTKLEKSGDFSQTYLSNTASTLILVHDPTTGTPYPGNKLPPTSITALGKAMMDLFPTGGLPGEYSYAITDSTGNRGYNSQFQWTASNPREDRVLRVDYNLGSRDSSFISFVNDFYGTIHGEGFLGPAGVQWGQLADNLSYVIPSAGVSANEIHTFTPSLVNEFSWGWNYAHQLVAVDSSQQAQAQYDTYKVPALNAAAAAYKAQGYGGTSVLPSLFSDSNTLNLIPNLNFSANGAQSAPQTNSRLPGFGWDNRWPFEGTDSTQNLTDSLTWIKGGHTLKAGLYIEHTKRNVNVGPFTGNGGFYSGEGTYWFGADSANPFDTGYSESNMLTGAVQSYGQDSKRFVNHAHYFQTEWFVTDNWKVSRRVTLDLGVRFVKSGGLYSDNAVMNTLVANNYSAAAMGKILFPICKGGAPATGQCSAANRAAQQYGGVGTIYPAVRATQFDPASYGANPFSGMTPFPNSFYTAGPRYAAPRLGFAWDVFGNGKMAVRGGFGIFYDRPYGQGVDVNGNLMTSAPSSFSPIYYNQSTTSLGQTSGAFYGPQAAYTGPQSFPMPSVYDWNLDIQRDLGRGVLLDIGYVANIHHHSWNQGGYDANALPPLTDWQPTAGPNTVAAPAPNAGGTYQAGYLVKTYLDPTSGSGGTAGFYSGNLPRALGGRFPGYGAVNSDTSFGEGSYHSLQVQLNRHFGRRLQFHANYTWQKTLNYAHSQWLPDQLMKNVAGNAHVLNINFNYLLPDGSKFLPEKGIWRNFLTKGVLDGWNVSGTGSYYTGGALAVGCQVSNAPIGYYTGTPTTQNLPLRCQQTGPLWLPAGSTPTTPGSAATNADPRLWYPFNANNFVLPPVSSWGVGNSQPTQTYAPGFEDWDVNIFKEFRMGKEQGRALQFRMTAYNIINHFNPGNPNISGNGGNLNYNYNTGVQSNTAFGTITGASGNARRITLTLKFRF